MNFKRTMKAASPLGALILAIGLVIVAAYGIAGFIGYYELGTGGTVSPYLANQVYSIYGPTGNQSNPTTGVFSTFGALKGQIQTQQNSTGGIIGSVSAAASAAGSAFSFTSYIINFLNPASSGSFVNVFMVIPLELLGVPATFASIIAYTILVAMLILLILSALLIFNLL